MAQLHAPQTCVQLHVIREDAVETVPENTMVSLTNAIPSALAPPGTACVPHSKLRRSHGQGLPKRADPCIKTSVGCWWPAITDEPFLTVCLTWSLTLDQREQDV